MSLFDRYGRLREGLRVGRLHTSQKAILSLLKGHVTPDDLPAVAVEPASEEELRTTLRFAAEHKRRVAVDSGVAPVGVRRLRKQMLVLTSRLAGAPVFRTSPPSVQVGAGVSVESLAVDCRRAGMQWKPLWPIPKQKSVGDLVAGGWEGLRNWRNGGTLAHIRCVEWMSYDGRLYSTGPDNTADGPDVSGFLFGSRGRLGVVISLELSLAPIPDWRAAAIVEFSTSRDALALIEDLCHGESLPEAVVYYGEVATRILREGNDRTVSENANVCVFVEWSEAAHLPERWREHVRLFREDSGVDDLWQDVFRLPRTAARLYPARVAVRLRVPADAIVALEDAARDLGRDATYPIAIWGTVEVGCLQVQILLPDGEARTHRRAEEAMKDFLKIAMAHGGVVAAGETLPPGLKDLAAPSVDSVFRALDNDLRERCDPRSAYVPVR